MRRILLLGATLAAAFVLASPAGAAPQGQGLEAAFPAECEGFGTVMVVTTRGGGATAWDLTTGAHIVLQSITASAGGEVVFTKTFGAKSNLPTVTCTTQEEQDGMLVDLTVVVAAVPPA